MIGPISEHGCRLAQATILVFATVLSGCGTRAASMSQGVDTGAVPVTQVIRDPDNPAWIGGSRIDESRHVAGPIHDPENPYWVGSTITTTVSQGGSVGSAGLR